MRGLSLIALLFSCQAFALTGSIDVNVQESRHGDFKGLLWSDVDETIGKGPSPVLTPSDVLAALNEEFADPSAALAQLEALKGPEGRVFFRYGYTAPNPEHPEDDGNTEHQCGVADKTNTIQKSYGQAGFGVSLVSGKDIQAIPGRASSGKFYQLKWASKAQIKRDIARCFSRLPGMPKLKKHAPKDLPVFSFSEEIYTDFFKWLSTYPGIAQTNASDPRLRKAVSCLLTQASERNEERTGNVIVIQKAKNSGADSPYKSSTYISESEFLPSYATDKKSLGKNSHVYSLAFMDRHSQGHLKKKWEKNTIQTQGIWPNFQGGSVSSLMAQAFGDELHVNMKACLLDSGLKIPHIDEMLPTIYDPFDCREVDTASIPPVQQLEYHCEAGKGSACFQIANNFHKGKKVICQPNGLTEKCHQGDGLRDIEKAREYYTKACDLGAAEGCFALAEVAGRSRDSHLVLSKEHLDEYQKACKIKDNPGCDFWNRGLNYVYDQNKSLYENGCNGPFTHREACHSLSVYYQKKGDRALAAETLRKSCFAAGFHRLPSPCIELSQIYLKDNKKNEAIAALKRECSAIGKVGCKELYDLLNEKEKKRLIDDVCWQTKQLCF